MFLFLRFMAALFWVITGFTMSWYISLPNGLQWVFPIITGFGIALPLMLVTLRSMFDSSKRTRLAYANANRNAWKQDDWRPEDWDEEDEEEYIENMKIEKERKFYEGSWKPNRLRSNKKINNKKHKGHLWD